MTIKIEIPEKQEDPERLERMNKYFLQEVDSKREHINSKVLVFVFQNKVLSTTEVMEIINDQYNQQYDKIFIHRVLKDLTRKKLLNLIPLSVAVRQNCETHKLIMKKYHKWVQRIPPQFQKRFRSINYYEVSEHGQKFLKMCSEKLGFKYSD